MAYYTQARTNSVIERILASLANAFDSAATAYAKHRVFRTTLNELRGLNDRELTDLGLNKTMLRGLALEAAEKTVAR